MSKENKFNYNEICCAKLDRFFDERGSVSHGLRPDHPFYPKSGLGEVYFSSVYNGVVKGWHIHDRMTMNYICIVGMIKLVIVDPKTQQHVEFFIGEENYSVVHIPPGYWNGFKGIGRFPMAVVCNVTDIPYDPNEIARRPWDSLPYNWDCQNG